jgi:hypothetical protein
MPKFRATFEDGHTIEVEAVNATEAKQKAKRQAVNDSGATTRTDARVKLRHIVNLDEEAGPTDPRNTDQPTGGARKGGY